MYAKYTYLKENAWCDIWGKRILSELYYLLELSKANHNFYQSLWHSAWTNSMPM